MLVQQILKAKGVSDVVTISPEASVGDAAKTLSEKRIGTVVISKTGMDAQGILSERDIVREIGRRGAGCLGEPVADMMTRNLITCHRDDKADGVLSKMTEGRFRHMPVMDGDQMVGLISLGDVVKARLSEVSMEKDALEGMIMGY
ncbi:CBS domain-containing protein [Actibacterium sp. 188UL27-1]|uniref:CBS domain-containing protein n=1 Tax=Actibacterium sp. 188UL27-1 TaxID=2786961 RepID=UPI00195D44A1|nr:CBS domain-containing protein [Actibacterium sp. 188UL27-1]MBM7067686.1 CBS domain-containing protein [Actibacterium sp. 188UL27-1]